MLNQVLALMVESIMLNIFGLKLQNANIAVGALVILFVVGYLLFNKADKLNKARQL